MIRKLLKLLLAPIFKNLDAIAPEIKNATTEMVVKIMKERNYKPSLRNDFIDLMLACKMKGKMIGESIEKKNADGTPVIVEEELSDSLIVAQVFAFFAAGFETSSSVASNTLHLLTYHPEIQVKCQEEIDAVLKKYDGKICYDAIQDMRYVSMVISESMRLLPSVPILLRKAVSKYTFPDSDLTIDENVRIIVPVSALHMDEKYFPEPNKFIPERFSEENMHKLQKYVYLPFGDGPRACIGLRLGKLEALTGVVAILSKCSVVPSENTVREPLNDPTAPFVVQITKGGNPMRLVPRKK